MEFVVRNIPASGLEGAFRIHLAPESLQAASLTFNEPCHIIDADGKVVGCGLAWRAADKMGASVKTRTVRLSETLRDAFGVKEGSQITLKPSNLEIVRAEKVVLTDVTLDPTDVNGGLEEDRWLGRCRNALYNPEAVVQGATFDVVAKKGVRRRFNIQNITSGSSQTGVPHLYFVTDRTNIIISDGSDTSRPLETHFEGHHFTPISGDDIGGLVDQIETLNRSIKQVLEQSQTKSITASRDRTNRPLLIHGYEGTGKSCLLERVVHTGFRKTLRLDSDTLDAGTTARNKSIIADVFSEALANQPSVILMDDLHMLAPATDDRGHGSKIGKQLDNISGEDVLVLATTRSLSEVHGRLLTAKRFNKFIELPIPDSKARTQVLGVMLRDANEEVRSGIPMLSSRTHGFTGEDLAKLVDRAKDLALSKPISSGKQFSEHLDHEQTNGKTAKEADEDSQFRKPTLQDFLDVLSSNAVRPTALREFFFETPKIKWSDIGGSQPIRSQVDEMIGWPLHRPEMMKQMELPPQKGLLLYGPPGCSKTLTAQAVAANYEMNFIAVKGAELISMYVGESERSVREIFRKARTAKPCVIFFDEIDSIASERDSTGTKGLNVLTTLLNEMDGFESLAGVFVLAATNKPETLDPAIMRPGRFDQHLYLPPPNDVARKEIVDLHLSRMPREDDMDTSKLVQATAGYTGAELVALCHLTKRGAARRMIANQGNGTIRMDDFEMALKETPPQVTKEVLAGYEAFAKRR